MDKLFRLVKIMDRPRKLWRVEDLDGRKLGMVERAPRYYLGFDAKEIMRWCRPSRTEVAMAIYRWSQKQRES